MSKYTTEVRFICESKSGLEDSSGADKIDEIIASSWDKIFTKKAHFFDENYRSVLCQKILKHYYLREIGCETAGIWKLWMNTRLEEIMPYYNQLYESTKIKFNPMHDTDLTRTHTRNVEGSTKEDGTKTENTEHNRTLTGNRDTDTTGNRTLTGNKEANTSGTDTRKITSSSDDTKKDLYSETPQGGISNLENETYLTNARKITDTVNGSGNEEGKTTGNSTGNYSDNEDTTENSGTTYSETENNTTNVNGTTSNTGTSNSTEDYLESVIGKQGSGTFSSMLNEFRETFLNIDMQVIEEFSDLFFGLW